MHKIVVTLLISDGKAAKHVFKEAAQLDLDGGGWIYTNGSGFVSMAGTIPSCLPALPMISLKLFSAAFSLCSRME